MAKVMPLRFWLCRPLWWRALAFFGGPCWHVTHRPSECRATWQRNVSYDEQYPEAEYLDIPGRESVMAGTVHPCWNCGQPTRFIEINFEAPLCSPACERQKDHEYWKAVSA